MSIFFFNDTATTEIYTLSLHDALPIFERATPRSPAAHRLPSGPAANASTYWSGSRPRTCWAVVAPAESVISPRSEEHTSELQSQSNIVCRLLLEKKK